MNTSEILVLIALVAGMWYWLDSIHVKHLACNASKRECDKAELEFLDETVVLRQVRLRRNSEGRVHVRRIYRFEFTSDEHNRFYGEVIMLGKKVVSVNLEPYRLP